MVELDGETNITKCRLFKISPIPSLENHEDLNLNSGSLKQYVPQFDVEGYLDEL